MNLPFLKLSCLTLIFLINFSLKSQNEPKWVAPLEIPIQLSGTLAGSGSDLAAQGVGKVFDIGTDGLIKAVVTSSVGSWNKKIKFGFDDSADTFIRKVFNTNPQVGNIGATGFYPSGSRKAYWLGETFEQEIRDTFSGDKFAMIAPLKNATAAPSDMTGRTELKAQTGWFIGQDLGLPGSYDPANAQKLFYLKDRGHNEWLNKNVNLGPRR